MTQEVSRDGAAPNASGTRTGVIALDRPDLKAAASSASLARGCVHVIGLEPLRERAGVRWERMRNGIHSRLEIILRQRLGPSDFFVPLDEIGYLVTMPGSESEDARIACLGAAFDLYTNYIGQCELDTVCLYRAEQAPGDAITLERLPVEQLKPLAERAGASNEKKPDVLKWRRTKTRSLVEAKVQFLPMWDAQNEAITHYYCEPKKLVLPFDPTADLTLNDLTPQYRANAEISCLYEGVTTMARHLDRGERFVVVFGVGYNMLSSHAARVEFTSACRDLPSDFRSYIVFRLTDVPTGVPRGRLNDLVMMVKPYARAVMSEIPDFCRNPIDYKDMGLYAVGLNLERLRMNQQGKAGEVAKFTAAAKRYALPTFLSGVLDSTVLQSARQGRVHFMTGRAIAAPLAEPRAMTRLHWDEVMNAAAALDRAGHPLGKSADPSPVTINKEEMSAPALVNVPGQS